MDSLQGALERAVEGEVRFDKISRAIYSTDASVYQIIPAGVVIPRSADDVIAALRICREHGVSITARGGGTSQSGQAVGAGIQIDFSKYMRRILEVDPEEKAVVVEPGIVVDELNNQLKPYGLQLPIDLSTASRATIGGMIANNSSGTRSIIYGSTIDYVLELEVLLADGSVVTMRPLEPGELEGKCEQGDLEGRCYRAVRRLAEEHAAEIDRRYPKILRRVGGYNLDHFIPSNVSFDLSKLMVGSEGTLGLVLKAKLRLVGYPGAKVLGVAQFEGLRDAMKATPVILGHSPSAVELMDRNLLEMTRGKIEFEPLRDFIVGNPGAVLIVEFMGESMRGLPERIDRLDADLRARDLTTHVHRAIDDAAQARIWKLRQAGLGLALVEKGDSKGVSYVEDTAVAPERLPEYIDRFLAILDENGTQASFYAHASVGLLHIRPAVDLKTIDGIEKFERIAEQVADLVLEFGGALSAEHGDGLVRSPFQRKMFGPVIYDAFCEIKETFDEAGVFNPGKIVHAPPIAENLRYGAEYRTIELETTLDFTDFGGIARAAEQCGGVAACRKTLTGTMCPSYMATLDESHSTRGRANALRLAISGQLGPGGLADPALYPVLDLCLECKACKSECPTGVDMARLKSEFLSQYHREHGALLRSRVLASTELTTLWGSRLAPVSNWILGNRLARWLGEATLGIDRRRALPKFSRQTFTAWWKRHSARKRKDGGENSPRVVVFADTFTNFFEPLQGIAAVRLAEKLGAQVEVPPRVCCGRPLISKGFLERARMQAEATTTALSPFAEAGVPIVFCEPGCYSAVRDDHPLLLRGELKQRAELVSAACLTAEEWAESALASANGTQNELVAGGPEKILLHAHCHQKALVGIDPSLSLLSRIPGCQVVAVDSGCCGLAGSFGYEREHYDVSKAVGERRLFPAIREREPGSTVVASGFSCRQQIRHFTDVEAISATQLIDSLLT
ncbi:MAG: FAD-binding protein [Gemmatimonadota bacterium]|nr:MAG: FAD-binding protein [Gemmatimonadota bacterium]